MEAVAYPHLALSADGVPHIAGQRTRVIDIVLDQIIHAWDAHQIQKQHPHLTLAQIHSALAYYHDHKEAMDQAIADRWRREEFLVAQLDCMPAQMRLRALKGGAMSLRFYMDHHVPQAITEGLRRVGIDCLTAAEDNRNRADDSILL